MADQIALPQVNIRPDVIGGDRIQPNPLDNFIHMFLESKQLKGDMDAQKAQSAIASGRLKVEQERLKLDQERERTQQVQHEMEGKGLQEMLKAFGETSAAHAQANGRDPMAGMMPQNQQQGPQQPAQAPNPHGQAQSPQMDPMQVFSGIVDKLPAGAVGDFVKNFSGIAQQAQAKKDQARAFAEAERSLTGLLGPDQAGLMKTARALFDAGAPSEMWQAMLPKAQLDLANGVQEVRAAKNKQDADRVATVQLTKLGLAPKAPVGMDEFVVDGAAKILADYVADVRKDARQANIARAASEREGAIKGLEGTALEIAASNPDWGPKQIKAAIKASPAYAGLSDGEISKVAFEAPKKAQALTGPANETQARMRVTYGPGRASLAVVNAMDEKGESLGIAARLAQTDAKTAGIGGAALGMAGAGPLGALAVGGAGLAGAPLIRGAARMSMSSDQQRLWTAAQNVAAMIFRPETGAQASDSEIRITMERYIPLNTDKPAVRAQKRAARHELDKTLAAVAGLPPQLQKGVLDQFLTKKEQELINGTSF